MKKFNVWIVILGVFLIALLIFSPLKEGFSKFVLENSTYIRTGLSNTGIKLKKNLSFFINISKLKKQNTELTEALINFNVDKSRITELEYENQLLKSELGFAEQNANTGLMSARIIGRESTTFLDHVIVDKGEENGVKKGSAVVSSGVLIGQVSEVYPTQSKIVLITSKDSIILAMLQNSRSKGLLRGGISGLVLENIVQDITFEPGEYVVTSGLDGQLPSGILIGKTGMIQSSSSDLFKNISVEPIVDLSKIELVFIMK